MAPKAPKGKVVVKQIKLQIPAGKATPAPPIGPALGQAGVNIMEFCKAYNDATRDKGSTVIPVEISVYQDKSFTFVLKTPPTTVMILQTLGLNKGSANPNTKIIGTLTRSQVEDIAERKLEDLNTADMDAAIAIVSGSARSIGVRVES